MKSLLQWLGDALASVVDAGLVGVLSLVAAVASVCAAFFAGRQLRHQRRRWSAQDARVATVLVLLSDAYSNDGWFHGVWQVTNNASFQLELVRILAKQPKALKVGALNPATNGPPEDMKVLSPGRFIEVSRVVPMKASGEPGSIGADFLYRLSNVPDSDRGRAIRLRFDMREVANPSHKYARDAEAVVPLRSN